MRPKHGVAKDGTQHGLQSTLPSPAQARWKGVHCGTVTAPLEFAVALRRGRPPKAHTQSMNVYRLAVLAGLPTAHLFFILSFFLIFFTKRKDFIRAIYIWISIITRLTQYKYAMVCR